MENRIAYDLKEGSVASKISISMLRRAIREGKLKASRVGRRVIIPSENLKKFIQEGWLK
ncbi:MAG TPA: helix-turn-helix domain-containing protein [Candidatus Saccharimonadales bacterium]|nr:helix-turn-helix domain-containing protein [Candidatus Saccharimonadales bacterium]